MDTYKMKILIVDDERSNLEVLTHILTPRDIKRDGIYIKSAFSTYTLCVAKCGQTALRKVAEEKPDLILLDVIMPDMSGFEVISELKKADETKDIPVIFITGLDSVEDEERGFFLGAVDYITKPFHGSLVRARVKTHLRIVEQMRTIERLGLLDTLTNLPNRRGFDNQLTTEWNRAIREKTDLSLLMIDIDHFKRLNDTYGHQQGDIALQAAAMAIKLSLKRPADLAARWGGEEFAVILPNTDAPGAAHVAETIRSNVEQYMIPSFGGHAIPNVTVSIGAVSTLPDISSLIHDFVARADEALYAAKAAGRNQVRIFEGKSGKLP